MALYPPVRAAEPDPAEQWAYPKAVRSEVAALIRAAAGQPKPLSREALDRLCARVKPAPSQAARLYFAIGTGELELFDALCGIGPDGYAADEDRKTALMYAAEIGQWDLLTRIVPLREKAERLEFECVYGERYYRELCDRYGYTALMHAASAGQVEAVNYLLNAGCPPEIKCRVARFDALQLAQNGRHTLAAAAIQRAVDQRERQRAEEESRSFGAWLWDMTLGNNNTIMALYMALFFQLVCSVVGYFRKWELIDAWTRLLQESAAADGQRWPQGLAKGLSAYFKDVRWRRSFLQRWLPVGPPPSPERIEQLARFYFQRDLRDFLRERGIVPQAPAAERPAAHAPAGAPS
jgi:hypothetical protein